MSSRLSGKRDFRRGGGEVSRDLLEDKFAALHRAGARGIAVTVRTLAMVSTPPRLVPARLTRLNSSPLMSGCRSAWRGAHSHTVIGIEQFQDTPVFLDDGLEESSASFSWRAEFFIEIGKSRSSGVQSSRLRSSSHWPTKFLTTRRIWIDQHALNLL